MFSNNERDDTLRLCQWLNTHWTSRAVQHAVQAFGQCESCVCVVFFFSFFFFFFGCVLYSCFDGAIVHANVRTVRRRMAIAWITQRNGALPCCALNACIFDFELVEWWQFSSPFHTVRDDHDNDYNDAGMPHVSHTKWFHINHKLDGSAGEWNIQCGAWRKHNPLSADWKW